MQQKDRDCEEKAPTTQPASQRDTEEREGKKNRAGSFPGPSNPNLLPLGFLRVRVRVPGFKC